VARDEDEIFLALVGAFVVKVFDIVIECATGMPGGSVLDEQGGSL
jgi:hypothetical protein